MRSVPVSIWPSGRSSGGGDAAFSIVLLDGMDGRRCNRHAIAKYRHPTVTSGATEESIKLPT